MTRCSLFLVLIFFPLFAISQSSMNMSLLGTYEWQTTNGNDIWGWSDPVSKNEYALVGLRNGFSCVNVSNPAVPIEEFFIADLNSIWRDVKTYGEYAYVTTEADAGLLIVDLTDMTGNTYWHVSQFTNPNTGASVTFTAAHNLYIDENGICYIFGASSNSGSNPSNGAIFLDIAANPIAPIYLGDWNDQYVHDAMVRGDTMYAGCISAGRLYIVDVGDKSNPITLSIKQTPNAFTHNAWISDDGNYVFTTDEKSGAYLTAYDISDLNNVQEVDRARSNDGSNSIPHNTYVDGNFLITSYYRDGTTVHDITYPENMIQVGYYDSYSGSGFGFDGCWGTYPYLPSGNIISSDINSGAGGSARLLVYSRNFQQASFLSGNISDASNGNNISNASVQLIQSGLFTTTNLLGEYNLGSVNPGVFQVLISAPGYNSTTQTVNLVSGVVTSLDVSLSSGLITPGCTDPVAINYDPLANIDDGSCLYLIDCFAPDITGLSVSDIIHDRVTLNFDNMNSYDANGTQLCRVDQIRIKYREVGTSSWSQKNMASPTGTDPVTGVCNSTQNTSKLVLNLSPSTTYEWEVKLWYCDGGNTGFVSGPNFTTLDACPNVANLAVSTPTTTKATFTWDASNGAYSFVRLKARPESANPQPSDWFSIGGAGVGYGTNTKNKNGLTPGQDYRGQARTWCDPNGGPYRATTWSSLVYWTQPTSVRLEGGESISNLDVYPNPSRDIFNITFVSETVQDLKVRVLNVIGEEIILEDLQQYVGEFAKYISLDNPKGIYFLEIETGQGIINKKLILQ